MNKNIKFQRSISIFNLLLILCLTLTVLSTTIVFCKSGFDFSDEGYYLINIAAPESYLETITRFGFFYHILYVFVHGDIFYLRAVNYLLIYALSFVISLCVIRQYNCCGTSLVERLKPYVLSLGISLSALLVNAFELSQSPSYNTMAFQGLLIFVIGLLIFFDMLSFSKIVGYILLSLGLSVIFFAKPTTFAVTSLILVIIFCFFGGSTFRNLGFVSIATLIWIAIVVLLTDGSCGDYLQNTLNGYRLAVIFNADSKFPNVFRSELLMLSAYSLHILIAFVTFVACVLVHIYFNPKDGSLYKHLLDLLLIICTAILLINPQLVTSLDRFSGVIMIGLPIAAILLRQIFLKSILSRENRALFIILTILPFAYAFGTNRPIWLNAQGTSFFWIIAALLVLKEDRAAFKYYSIVTSITIVVVLIVSVFRIHSEQYPMRQLQALRDMNSEITSPDGSHLRVSKETQAYLERMQQIFYTHGFNRGDNILCSLPCQ